MKTYHYLDYWANAFSGQDVGLDFIPDIIEHLKHLDFKYVLELGSGKGVLSKELKENFDIVLGGLDIVGPNKYLDNFYHGDLSKMQFHHKFDLIVGRFILMHIKPADIKHVIKLINHNSKLICFVDYNPFIRVPLSPHNFKHKFPWHIRQLTPLNVLYFN